MSGEKNDYRRNYDPGACREAAEYFRDYHQWAPGSASCSQDEATASTYSRSPIPTKRKTPPNVLTPAEIKLLLDRLASRERMLVLLAASAGLRQRELFGLKWADIDFELKTMYVTRSIVCGVVGPCKTESSQ